MGHNLLVGSQVQGEERAVPGVTDLGNVCLHIARYNLALLYADKKRVYDAACGTGYGSFLLSLVAQQVQGIDLSPVAIEYAQSRYQAPHLSFAVGDVCALSESVDLIVSFETTEHILQVSTWEETVYQTLAPGGKLIFSVPLNESPGENPYHTQVYTLETARLLFPKLRREEELIQQGVNFYPPTSGINPRARYLAYIGVMRK